MNFIHPYVIDPIYGLIFFLSLKLEVNVTDQQNAAYLEGHIAHYVWKVH